MSRIVMHIDRLVLNGIDPADAEALSNGLHEALRQSLLRSPDAATLLAQDRHTSIRLSPVQAGTTAEATGLRIGELLVGRLLS